MLKVAVHVTTWCVKHQNWILFCCFTIWLTEVNAFCHPPEAFETKSISSHNKVMRLWCNVITNDCCACCLGRTHLMHTGYVSLSKLPRTKFNCVHLNLYSLQKNKKKVCRSFGRKGHNKSELGQDRKSGLIDKKKRLKIIFRLCSL